MSLFQRDNDYSAESSTEMRRQNEQITPLKFSATAFQFETDKYALHCALTLSGRQSKQSGR